MAVTEQTPINSYKANVDNEMKFDSQIGCSEVPTKKTPTQQIRSKTDTFEIPNKQLVLNMTSDNKVNNFFAMSKYTAECYA